MRHGTYDPLGRQKSTQNAHSAAGKLRFFVEFRLVLHSPEEF
jgi:hypothetical protein